MATTTSRSPSDVLTDRRSKHHVPSGLSKKKYEAFFSDDESPRSHRNKHYSDEEDSDEDDSFDRSRDSYRKPSSRSQPPPRPKSRNPFSDAVTLDPSKPKRSESFSDSGSYSSISESEVPKRSSRRGVDVDDRRERDRREKELKRKERERKRVEDEEYRRRKEEDHRRRKERRRREEEKERRRREEEKERERHRAKDASDNSDGSFSFDEQSEDEEERQRRRKKEKEREREKEKERERRHRHRHRHHPRSSSRERSSKSKSKKNVKPGKKAAGVDTIDRLDVTGLFGGAFHHDGPFDACNPHRNKNTKVAPVMAFPVDGPNSTIKGMGPNNTKEQTIDTVLGKTPDETDPVYQAPASVSQARVGYSAPLVSFDAKMKEEPIHGETTLGLGSSTFLEGAPASRIAQQEEQKFDQAQIGRKKSLSRRLLNSNPQAVPQARRKSDDDVLSFESPEKNSLLNRVKSLKVSRSRTQHGN